MRILTAVLFAISLPVTTAFGQAGDAGAPRPLAGSRASFTPAPSGLFVELRGGFAALELEDADANIGWAENVAVEVFRAPGDFRRFDRAQSFGLEVGYRRGALGFGLLTELERQRPHTFAAGDSLGAVDAIALLSAIDVRFNASWRPRWMYGFEFGGSAGLAFAHYSESFGLYVFADPGFNATLSGTFRAVSFAGGPHVGWRRPLHGSTWLVARAAWIHRRFDELEGQYRVSAGGETHVGDDVLRRMSDGEPASLDAGGPQLTVGLSHTFGARR